MSTHEGQTMGATLYATIARCSIGAALHHLEYHADVHLVNRMKSTSGDYETWELRSDQWPRSLDKQDVVLMIVKGKNGLEFVTQ